MSRIPLHDDMPEDEDVTLVEFDDDTDYSELTFDDFDDFEPADSEDDELYLQDEAV